MTDYITVARLHRETQTIGPRITASVLVCTDTLVAYQIYSDKRKMERMGRRIRRCKQLWMTFRKQEGTGN